MSSISKLHNKDNFNFMCIEVCVHMQMLVYVTICIHDTVRGQPPVLVLSHSTLFFFYRVSYDPRSHLVDWAGLLGSPRNHCVSISSTMNL